MNDTPLPVPGPVHGPGSSGTPPTVLIVVAIIALIAITVIWVILKGYLREKADQHIFYRKDHRDGRLLVAERFRFTIHAPLPKVIDTIVATMRVSPGIPTALPEVHIKEASANRIVLAYGSTLLRKNFTAALDVAVNGDLTVGAWQITGWTTTNGVVDCVSTMRRLRADLDKALSSLDPAYPTRT